jgi:hypothetical protein
MHAQCNADGDFAIIELDVSVRYLEEPQGCGCYRSEL